MKKTNSITKVKILLLGLFMGSLSLTLALSIDKIVNKGILLIYISTWILVLHIWLGAYYIVRYLEKRTDILDISLDTVSLACMVLAVLNFHKLIAWSILFAVLFTAAIIRYLRVYLHTKDSKVKEYALKKIKNEIIAIPLLILLAVLTYIFNENDFVMLFFQSITLAFQIFFAVWMVYIKKVYNRLKN